MYRKLIYLVSVVSVLSLASTTYGIVISNFENSMDGWSLVDPPDPNILTSFSTTGVTLGNYSLRLSAPGDYINALRFGLSGQVRNDFLSRKLLTVDVTRLASEWTASGEYCQLLLAVNGGGSGWSVWQVLDETADWSPDQGNQTITLTFDYSSTLGDINLSSIWWFELFLITNYDPNYYDPNEPHYTAGGVYYLDNIQLIGDERAIIPNPADGARNVRIEPTLSWVPGDYVDTHDVYFGTSFNSVKNANKSNLPSDIIYINIDVNSYKPATLGFNTTYYWRVDEVNNAHPDKLWKGTVWSFTTGNYIAVDDFESYNDFSPYKIFQTWLDGVGYSADEILPGYGGNETGSAVGSNAKPWAEQLIVHSGFQSMPFKYINDGSTGKALYSEIFRQWDDPQDWTTEEGKALSLWFRGYPATIGSYTYNAVTGVFTVKADGADIWGTADEFHFVYKELTGDADIIARVVSCENTNEWAKAGVMIRDSLDEDSAHALMCVTPSGRRAFQNRPVYKGTSMTAHSDVNQITIPYWVRLIREPGIPNDVIKAYHSTDGTPDSWVPQPTDEYTGDDASDNPAGITMTDPVYIGLAYTSHTVNTLGQAMFSDVKITGNVNEQWQSQDVPKNDAEQLYLVIEDADEVSTVVKHPDPNAVLFDTFQEWTIYLQDINDAGVDLKNIKRMYIGVGDRYNPVSGGTGKLYIDDIRLYRSGCMLSKRSADFAKADYAPTGDPAGDCVIDYQEIEIMARDWLIKDEILEVGAAGFIAYYPLDEGTGTIATDASGNGNDGTLVGNPQWVAGQIDGALQFDGTDDCVNLGNKPAFNPSGSFSISLWANITNWLTNWAHAMIGNRGEDGVGWQLRRHSNDNFCFTTRGIGRDDTASETIPPLNEWIHIACVYDNINNTKSIYLNGVQDKVVTTNPGSITETTHNTYIGARANSGNTGQEAFFSGMLDDVRIYNRPLLPGEVEFLADPTPGDGQLYIPVSSPAELYEAEERGSRAINLKDFAVLVDMWLLQQVWP